MEHETESSRMSRPFSVREMGERIPALGLGTPPPAPNGNSGNGGAPTGAVERPSPGASASQDADVRDPVFIVRESGEILFANCSLGDRTEDEVIGSSIFDWIVPDQHDPVKQSLAQAFANGETRRQELAGLRNHDDEGWYDCRITPNVRDGRVVSATIVAHEITQYKRSLEQLEASYRDAKRLLEERTADLARASQTIEREAVSRQDREREWQRFRSLMDHAGDAIFVTDYKTERVVDINETGARWLGGSRDDIVGRRLHELSVDFPVLPPVELELEFTETRDTRRPLMLRGTHHRKDGTSFPVETAVARHRLGSEDLVLAVARDMKGRVEAEEELDNSRAQYRGLFEQCWDAIYLTARDGEIEDVNAAAIELFGYAKDAFVGLDARQLFARPMDIKRFQVQMSTLGAVGDLEVELLTKDGTVVPSLLSATRRPSRSGTIRGYQVIVRPVSMPAADDIAPEGDDAEEPTTDVRTVVVADEGAALGSAEGGLRAAGMRVLKANSTEAALDLVRLHGESIDAAVFDADVVGADLRSVLEVVRQFGPQARIVVLTDEEPVEIAASIADLGVRSILRKPIHPLALIQKIREA